MRAQKKDRKTRLSSFAKIKRAESARFEYLDVSRAYNICRSGYALLNCCSEIHAKTFSLESACPFAQNFASN